MFEFLGVLVVKVLDKIMGEAIDLGKQSLLDRRKLFRKFFDLYEALVDLEKESRTAYAEFAAYANGTEVLTRTIPAKKLDSLQETLDKFARCASELSSIIDLYEGRLLVSLNDVASIKGMHLRYLRLMLPEAIGYELYVPTKRPLVEARIDMSKGDYDSKKYLQSEQARDQFGVVRIDLRERGEIVKIMGNSEAMIDKVSLVKEQLGAFIRTNFPLDKVIA